MERIHTTICSLVHYICLPPPPPLYYKIVTFQKPLLHWHFTSVSLAQTICSDLDNVSSKKTGWIRSNILFFDRTLTSKPTKIYTKYMVNFIIYSSFCWATKQQRFQKETLYISHVNIRHFFFPFQDCRLKLCYPANNTSLVIWGVVLNDSCQSSRGTTLKGHLDKSVIDKILSGEGYIAAARKP